MSAIPISPPAAPALAATDVVVAQVAAPPVQVIDILVYLVAILIALLLIVLALRLLG